MGIQWNNLVQALVQYGSASDAIWECNGTVWFRHWYNMGLAVVQYGSASGAIWECNGTVWFRHWYNMGLAVVQCGTAVVEYGEQWYNMYAEVQYVHAVVQYGSRSGTIWGCNATIFRCSVTI